MNYTFFIDGIQCKYSDKSLDVTIYDSSKIKDKDVLKFTNKVYAVLQTNKNLPQIPTFDRNVISWATEIIAHNRLYRLGLFVEHTKDTDIENHESLFRRFCYWFLALPYSYPFIKEDENH